MSEKPHIRVVAAEIVRDGKYLLTQRRAHAVLPLLWEFPGGRVEVGEKDETALARELSEKIGVVAMTAGCLLEVAHEYDGYTLDLAVYRVEIEGEPQAKGVEEARWVSPEDFGQYTFPGADQHTVDALLGLEN
jgi:8-oxo-dGTP diphosphatase